MVACIARPPPMQAGHLGIPQAGGQQRETLQQVGQPVCRTKAAH